MGPVIGGKNRRCFVHMTKFKRTARLRWDIDEIDICGQASADFEKECVKLGMMDSIIEKCEARKKDFGRDYHGFYGNSIGFIRGIPFDLSDELFMFIIRTFAQAVANMHSKYPNKCN